MANEFLHVARLEKALKLASGKSIARFEKRMAAKKDKSPKAKILYYRTQNAINNLGSERHAAYKKERAEVARLDRILKKIR